MSLESQKRQCSWQVGLEARQALGEHGRHPNSPESETLREDACELGASLVFVADNLVCHLDYTGINSIPILIGHLW